jgi:hypothetical protein
MTKVISKLTPEIDAKRAKRTGLQIERWQPRPDHLPSGGDCAVRSACWATGEKYEDVFAELQQRANACKRRPVSILRAGTPLSAIKDFYRKRGWTWVKVLGELKTTEKRYASGMKIRTTKRANVLFKAENLPKKLCVAITTEHAVAVDDHVVLDSYDSRGDRSSILEGYFVKKDN